MMDQSPRSAIIASPEESNGEASASARSTVGLGRLLDVLPAAAYTTDAAGLITDFNRRAVELWGREPLRNNPLDRY
jgi:PAS domain-containing protein